MGTPTGNGTIPLLNTTHAPQGQHVMGMPVGTGAPHPNAWRERESDQRHIQELSPAALAFSKQTTRHHRTPCASKRRRNGLHNKEAMYGNTQTFAPGFDHRAGHVGSSRDVCAIFAGGGIPVPGTARALCRRAESGGAVRPVANIPARCGRQRSGSCARHRAAPPANPDLVSRIRAWGQGDDRGRLCTARGNGSPVRSAAPTRSMGDQAGGICGRSAVGATQCSHGRWKVSTRRLCAGPVVGSLGQCGSLRVSRQPWVRRHRQFFAGQVEP